ncbi:putative helicase mov-10-B.1 [Phymastichus coffea]|uniref:putative helicase mov-10-B.1 n=1 Tax=Phymastichus coffea TaxID=108790 RepID=UPI00273CC595|nr:putative helicase mov-10-B.1 [Phymastichus coffea]XP_058807116.1 putative helicase mov-10-B.1 [Phymastichus coffea]XP_058807117.1 putative helicase mov-10-B.1 [Phymastichus coffea]XP_058807118.1 putative helicase mov-10-B.1 [Phymastichus coffea]
MTAVVRKSRHSSSQLPEYAVPKDLIAVLDGKDSSDFSKRAQMYSKILRFIKSADYIDMAESHYIQLLKLAVYIEEYQSNREMKKHEMTKQIINRINSNDLNEVLFRIDVDDLDEEKAWIRPSDFVDVTDISNDATYTLKVINVAQSEIITTDESGRLRKMYNRKNLYDIKFRLQNYSLRCNHYALWIAHKSKLTNYLYPYKSKPFIKTQNTDYKELEMWHNTAIEMNPEQKQAVLNILNKSAFPAPYILYGPPGTGKTATLVEAICQIHNESQNNRVLVCTPSNTAADEIARRLMQFMEVRYLYRIYGQSRDKGTIDEELKSCSNCQGSSTEPVKYEDILGKRVFVTTLGTAARLVLMRLSVYYFSHIIIDEAGQGTEPDILLPIIIASKDGELNSQVVLAGDPKQLGPTVISKIAETIIGRSILERLMSYDTYQKGSNNKYNPRYITKLLYNYRSDPKIIQVSNELFYENELIPKFQKKYHHRHFPVLFYGVEGTEEKSNYSTSTWNSAEIHVVEQYVEDLLQGRAGLGNVSPKDIGIITPFTLQSKRIKRSLRGMGLKDISVGTVELFQGQEKKIMIMTAVRSKTFFHEGKEHIGFLSNPKRFNVALTRAKNLLIVIGNPKVLQQNYMWRYLVEYCIQNKSYFGSPFSLESSNYRKNISGTEKIVDSKKLFQETPFQLFMLDERDTITDLQKTMEILTDFK